MDDLFEKPSSSAQTINADAPDDAVQSSDEDDGGPDWTKLSSLATSSSSRPVIPKRGDKEFEPADSSDGGGRGTDLQQYKLERVREAMFGALDVERTVSSKSASYAVWCPGISRARLLSARGNFVSTMGHNVPRDVSTPVSTEQVPRKQKKTEKNVELLPEEVLYLVERGSMFCWSQIEDETADEGTPMTVQQAYAEMIGKEELTLERYQVYAYLKRLGYTVTRALAPDPYYNTTSPLRVYNKQDYGSGLLHRIASTFMSPLRWLFGSRPLRIDWWHPLKHGFVHRILSYSSIFSTLRFIPSGYSLLLQPASSPKQPTPYEVFFHLYKPATPYRKTAPPPPDFSVIVVDGRKTPMPTLSELCTLFEQLPELPPPTPRKRYGQAKKTGSSVKKIDEPQKQTVAAVAHPPPFYVRLYDLFRWLLCIDGRANDKAAKSVTPPRRPNPFQMLKNGKKMIVVAAVDSGMISIFRFCQGSFDEWPMA